MMTAAEIDEFEAAAAGDGPKVDVSKLPRPDIQNGFYTLTFPCGSHRTFRLHTQQKGSAAFRGRRMLGMLIGPDNTADYETFAFLEGDGFKVWKRFQNQKQAEYAEKLFALMTGREIEGHSVEKSGRCLKCNRPLTDPESIRLGIGPLCRGDDGKPPKRLRVKTVGDKTVDLTPRAVDEMYHPDEDHTE